MIEDKMKDIKINIDGNKFKYRVNAIIIKENKLLAIKMKNNKSYCLPGGHVELGENSRDATIREVKEELDIDAKIEKEIAFVENFYLDKFNLKTHELSLYYLVSPINLERVKIENYSRQEIDKGEKKTLNFEWIDLKELNSKDFKPSYIKSKLCLNNLDFEHLTINQL